MARRGGHAWRGRLSLCCRLRVAANQVILRLSCESEIATQLPAMIGGTVDCREEHGG